MLGLRPLAGVDSATCHDFLDPGSLLVPSSSFAFRTETDRCIAIGCAVASFAGSSDRRELTMSLPTVNDDGDCINTTAR